jgi:hypothetical protein
LADIIHISSPAVLRAVVKPAKGAISLVLRAGEEELREFIPVTGSISMAQINQDTGEVPVE